MFQDNAAKCQFLHKRENKKMYMYLYLKIFVKQTKKNDDDNFILIVLFQ